MSAFRNLHQLVLVSAFVLTSCSAANQNGQVGAAQAGKLSPPSNNATDAAAKSGNGSGSSSGPSLPSLPPGSKLLAASFHITVGVAGQKDNLYSIVNLPKICEGDINLAIKGDATALSGDISKLLALTANSPINCGDLIGTLDVTKLLGLFLAGGATATGAGLPIQKVGNTLALKSFAGVTYNPPRPLFPALLNSSKEQLTQLNVSQPSQMTIGTSNYSGTFGLSMEAYDAPYTPPGMKFNFPHSMHFIISSSGFDGADPVKGLIFDRLEVRLSTAPVAITQLLINGRADKLLPAVSKVPEEALTGLLKLVIPILKGSVTSTGIDHDVVFGVSTNLYPTISIDLTNQEGLSSYTTSDSLGATVNGTAVSAR